MFGFFFFIREVLVYWRSWKECYFLNGNEKVRDKIFNYSWINLNLKFVGVCFFLGKNILLFENKISFKFYIVIVCNLKKKDDV